MRHAPLNGERSISFSRMNEGPANRRGLHSRFVMVALATGNECPVSLTPISAGGWAAPDRVLAVMTASALETDFPLRTFVARDRSSGCRVALAPPKPCRA